MVRLNTVSSHLVMNLNFDAALSRILARFRTCKNHGNGGRLFVAPLLLRGFVLFILLLLCFHLSLDSVLATRTNRFGGRITALAALTSRSLNRRFSPRFSARISCCCDFSFCFVIAGRRCDVGIGHGRWACRHDGGCGCGRTGLVFHSFFVFARHLLFCSPFSGRGFFVCFWQNWIDNLVVFITLGRRFCHWSG